MAVEIGDDSGKPLAVPTKLIAEKFTEYYWRQAIRYIPPGSSGAVLRQNTGGPAEVLTHLAKARGTESSFPALKRDSKLWNKLLNIFEGFY